MLVPRMVIKMAEFKYEIIEHLGVVRKSKGVDKGTEQNFMDKYIGWKPVTLVMGGKPSLKHLRRFFFCLFPFPTFHTSI